jgi:hypothetical protein
VSAGQGAASGHLDRPNQGDSLGHNSLMKP